MWYVIQTQTGREQELTECIERVLKGNGYRACFVIEQECVWRNAGEFLAYQKPLFPSYVIVDTDTPEEFFLALKRVPKLSKHQSQFRGFFGTSHDSGRPQGRDKESWMNVLSAAPLSPSTKTATS